MNNYLRYLRNLRVHVSQAPTRVDGWTNDGVIYRWVGEFPGYASDRWIEVVW